MRMLGKLWQQCMMTMMCSRCSPCLEVVLRGHDHSAVEELSVCGQLAF